MPCALCTWQNLGTSMYILATHCCTFTYVHQGLSSPYFSPEFGLTRTHATVPLLSCARHFLARRPGPQSRQRNKNMISCLYVHLRSEKHVLIPHVDVCSWHAWSKEIVIFWSTVARTCRPRARGIRMHVKLPCPVHFARYSVTSCTGASYKQSSSYRGFPCTPVKSNCHQIFLNSQICPIN